MNPANGALPGRVIVGLGYLPHGALKVYIDANDLNRFIVINDPLEQAKALQQWADEMQGVIIQVPAPSQEPHVGS
jgi:hypothetical protein